MVNRMFSDRLTIQEHLGTKIQGKNVTNGGEKWVSCTFLLKMIMVYFMEIKNFQAWCSHT